MPRIRKPYYNIHQIRCGQYSPGNEFVLQDGSIYIGPYHILPTGQRFSEFQPSEKSVELFELRLNPTQDILRYNQITGNEINRSVTPVIHYPNPTFDDYKRGIIERFFIQKRNSPKNTILEIDYQQYNSINTLNNPGINGVLWNKLKVQWRISKIPSKDAEYLNSQVIQKSEPSFNGITSYLTNFLEFYR